ncbi:MAG TPA: hypothetical protein DGG94_11730 [Micromonosporaceae bacterium]|nr:hypothetical protein [Micromonosporaceae bacterium]HCU50450.1 hypothetical protein [Micromonosporaceae bacterium]
MLRLCCRHNLAATDIAVLLNASPAAIRQRASRACESAWRILPAAPTAAPTMRLFETPSDDELGRLLRLHHSGRSAAEIAWMWGSDDDVLRAKLSHASLGEL